ncbi:hypothetical protein ACFCXK_09625 [Streptomyces sp. NPDC056269]|uniref:hypothetical protein n=1 Tax=Streptomyces sp. NPDC056269 TaxID=3345768 RepID=UPI0035E3160A
MHDLTATGDPVLAEDEIRVEVGVFLKEGTLALAKDGQILAPFHALVKFNFSADGPWLADSVKFSGKASDGTSAVLAVDLLNDTFDGARAGLPESIWEVVALVATSAGDIGITYSYTSGG